jgi:LmbE family N-acetylglucosaminyl deacetylase
VNAGQLLQFIDSSCFSTLDRCLGTGGLVVIAPHPDDESLACGGLIAEARAQGRPLRVVIVSDGTGSHPDSRAYPMERLRELRESEAKRAVEALGLDPERDLLLLRLPDRFVPSEGPAAEAAIGRIVDCARVVNASAMFVSWRQDPHCDHQASYLLARAAQRRVPDLGLYEYTVWGAALPPETPVEPANGFRLDVERWLTRKRLAIAAHRSQTTDLIDDDPGGFRLTPDDLARFDRPYEFFFESD